MMTRLVLPICAVACLLIAAAPAPAQEPRQVPADAVVVAGPTPSGATLVAFRSGGQLCTGIRLAGRAEASTCARPPVVASQARATYAFDSEDVGAHGGVVSDDVSRVELRFERGGDVPADTVPGEAYRGPGAGRLRFWVADGPSRAPWLRLYSDAGGRVLAGEDEGFERPLVEAPTTLAEGRSGGKRWRLRAVSRLRLAPTPLDRARIGREVCIGIAAGRSSSTGVCHMPDAIVEGDLVATPDSECGRTLLPVVTRSGVARVEAVLGDGRRARVALVDVPARLVPGRRAGALIVDGAVAVRRLEGFDARGRRVERFDTFTPPARPCRPGFSGSTVYVSVGGFDGWSGPLRFAARHGRVRLFVALGDFDPQRRDCSRPSGIAAEASLFVRRAGGRAIVAGLVAPEVASVEVTVDGRVQRLPTVGDIPGYGGQYRDALRFVTLEVPATARLGRARFLDATGREIERQQQVDPRVPEIAARRTVRLGGVTLTLRQIAMGVIGYPCVGVETPALELCRPADQSLASIVATCSPRRLVIFGAGSRTLRSVRVTTSVGTRHARLVPVGRRRVWVVVLPARARVRAIYWTAGQRRSARPELPAAASQCGYGDDTPFRGNVGD